MAPDELCYTVSIHIICKAVMDEHRTEGVEQPRSGNTRVRATNSLAVPIAIVIGFALVAGAIFFSSNRVPLGDDVGDPKNAGGQAGGPVRAVDENDHIRGNPNAPIMIVEFSDFDCPFCKRFHETMNQVMQTYGNTGRVAWVYRHFPLEQIHPSAPRVAAASECVAELAGNDAFWTFSDLAFGERGVNEPTNLSRLTEFATTAGANPTQFEECLNSGRMADRVNEDVADALNAGAEGTPYSVIIVGDRQGVIPGAETYETVSGVIDSLLAQIDGQ